MILPDPAEHSALSDAKKIAVRPDLLDSKDRLT